MPVAATTMKSGVQQQVLELPDAAENSPRVASENQQGGASNHFSSITVFEFTSDRLCITPE